MLLLKIVILFFSVFFISEYSFLLVISNCNRFPKKYIPIVICYVFRTTFRNTLSSHGDIITQTQLEIEFRRSLHQNNWIQAEQCLDRLHPLDEEETMFLKLQLMIWRGEATEIQKLLTQIEKKMEKGKKYSIVSRVRFHICEAELFCLTNAYAGNLALRFHVEH